MKKLFILIRDLFYFLLQFLSFFHRNLPILCAGPIAPRIGPIAGNTPPFCLRLRLLACRRFPCFAPILISLAKDPMNAPPLSPVNLII